MLKDLTNQKFGEWVVLSREPNGPDSRARWLCSCSCGTRRVHKGKSLLRGTTRSCGCRAYRAQPYNNKGYTYTPPAQRNSPEYFYKKTAAQLAARARNSRGLKFSLSIEEASTIIAQACSYCGGEPSIPMGALFRNTIDRIDSSKGYISGNCVSACLWCQWGKNTLTPEQYRDHVQRVTNWLQSHELPLLTTSS